MNKAANSNVKDPENRSRKHCVCGCHGAKNSKPRRKNIDRTTLAEALHDAARKCGMTEDPWASVGFAEREDWFTIALTAREYIRRGG